MSSSAKFPSGLNNWAGNDLPARLDFVGDNEILDQNAMWKSVYDDTGAVATAGGIAQFSLEKSIYDPDGTIANAGGIAGAINTAVNTNEGLTPYWHSKSGDVHTLSGVDGTNIKFTATADYNDNDTFVVNGVACIAQMNDGQPLTSRAFVAGAVVVCYRNGNTLNFKMGGTELNYRVIVSTVRPSTPYKNTLWVQSSIPLNRYAMSPDLPSFLNQTGDLYIKTGASNISFNAQKNNTLTVLPQAAMQYNSAGKWIGCPLEYFNGSQWAVVTGTLWLLNGTETYKNLTGGWHPYLEGTGYWYNNKTGMGSTPNPYEFFPTGQTPNKIADIVTTLPIDLTSVRFLTLDYTAHSKYGNGVAGLPHSFLYITATAGGNHRNHAVASTNSVFEGRFEMTLNVENYNGLYYVGAGMTQRDYATNGIQIWRIWGTY